MEVDCLGALNEWVNEVALKHTFVLSGRSEVQHMAAQLRGDCLGQSNLQWAAPLGEDSLKKKTKKTTSVNPLADWNLFLLQTEASSQSTPPSPGHREKCPKALHCSLRWLKASHQESHPRFSSGQLSYTQPRMVWMDEDCIAPCFSCIRKFTCCLNFCRNQIPWLCLCLGALPTKGKETGALASQDTTQPSHPALVLISRLRVHKYMYLLKEMFLEMFLQEVILTPRQSSYWTV